MLEDVLKRWGGQEVTAMDVYRDMFQPLVIRAAIVLTAFDIALR